MKKSPPNFRRAFKLVESDHFSFTQSFAQAAQKPAQN